MSVSAICGGYPAAAVAPVQGGVQVQAAQTPAAFAPTPDQVDFSQAGSSMSQLLQLQKTDPERFKEVTQKISDSLATAAGANGDPLQSQFLTEMSQKFAASAQTGALPDLSSQTAQGANAAGNFAQALGHGGQMLSGLISGVGNLLTGHIATAMTGGLAAIL